MSKHAAKKKSPVKLLIILVLVLIALYSGFQILKAAFPSPSEEEPEYNSQVITRGGIDYFPRQDITVFMLLGIDQFGPVQASESHLNEGEADVVVLAVFDEKDKAYRLLILNRDTMVEMPVLGVGGQQAGTARGQLALSHTYGTGLEDSCENTRQAVSDLLLGAVVDYYISMNMDAISILNDAVGGVKVTVTDDFSFVDPSIPMGETVLRGSQALSFVQGRKNVGDQLNLSRMERHRSYMNGFMEAWKAKSQQNSDFLFSTYDSVDEYLVSDCSFASLSALMNRYEGYPLAETLSLEGKNSEGDGITEFYADEEALEKLALRLFYAPVGQ